VFVLLCVCFVVYLFLFVFVCFVLFCFVLFCFVLFCFVLLCFVLLCFVCLFSVTVFGLVRGGTLGFAVGAYLGVLDVLESEKITSALVSSVTRRALLGCFAIGIFMGGFGSLNCFFQKHLHFNEVISATLTGASVGATIGCTVPKKIPLLASMIGGVCGFASLLHAATQKQLS